MALPFKFDKWDDLILVPAPAQYHMQQMKSSFKPNFGICFRGLLKSDGEMGSARPACHPLLMSYDHIVL